MTHLTRSIAFIFIVLASLFLQTAIAQSVINPADPVVNYDPNHPPTPPGYMQMGKWVRTPNAAVHGRNDTIINGVTHPWNTDVYKAYIWAHMAFRVQFPKSYNPTANDGKKYPVIVFLHGKGEIWNSSLYINSYDYDNEFQLLQGPHEFDGAIKNGTYDGYVIAPQIGDLWYYGDFLAITQILDYMIANNKVDPFHIMINGLSAGGDGCWDFFRNFPQYVSSLTPMSSPLISLAGNPNDYMDSTFISNKKFTSMWLAQGAIDTRPSPALTQQLQDSMTKYGANFKRTVYANTGHGTWYNFWAEPDFWPFINRSYMSNPWMLRGLRSPWPGEPFIDTIGVMPGFSSYQWRLNGNVIPTQTNNKLIVIAPGIYEARVQNGTLWSDWSHVPLNLRTGFYEAENYVAMSGVQTEATTDINGGLDVGYIDNGDWMDYTIKPYTAGIFTLQLRVAALFGGGQVQIRKSDSTVLATVTIPATGGFQNWTTVSTTVTLPAGTQNIRLKSVANTNWNINWLQFSTIAQGPLPIRFVYFNSKCQGGGVNLEWKTAQEVNSRNFEIQKSIDGASWNSMASIAASGQSSVEKTYQYRDNTTSGATAFYRIVENDLDGRSQISSIVRSSCFSKTELSISPNPSSGNATLNINLEQSTKVVLLIVDSKGALMKQSEIMLPAGNSTVPLTISNFAEGVYSINVRYNNEMKTLKLIKK